MESDLVKERLRKLEALKAMGVEPFGHRLEKRQNISELTQKFTEGQQVNAAGRLMAIRLHGKSAFADLRDSSGRIQLFIKKDELSERDWAIFEQLDIGDIISIEGILFKTKTGQESVKVNKIELMSKSIRPLPEKWHGLKDTEARYRHRYLDLAANDEVLNLFKKRSKIISTIRTYLDSLGYLEVETPMMHPIPGGAAGKPFKTHHEALNADLFLRVAPELYLKKLLVGGYEKVYEINKSFRNEGISTRHNPEFTMLELYTAYHDVNDVMNLCEALVKTVAEQVFEKLRFGIRPANSNFDAETENILDLSEWKRVSFSDLMKESYGIVPNDDTKQWIEKLRKKGVEIKDKNISRTQIINIVAELIAPVPAPGETKVLHPTFVTDYFTELSPLARRNKKNPLLADRFELYIGGMEVANGYSEQNDPIEQRARLLEELKEKGKEASEGMLDEDFLYALEHGMPPAGGLGIGIDRLCMVLAQQPSIREVVLFPQLKPEPLDAARGKKPFDSAQGKHS